MEAIEKAAIRAFENRTLAHLQEYFPGHCKLLGEEQMRRVIQFGWDKARHYELTAECCVRTYIEFMCLLGGRFDTNPLMPWAAEILNDRSSGDQIARGDRLYDRAHEYIRHLVPDYRDARGEPITARFVADLQQLRTAPDTPIPTSALPVFAGQLKARLKKVFPAKFDYVGEDNVTSLVANGIGDAARYDITGERGLTLFITLAFVLGPGFVDDPLMPWASTTLNDKRINTQKRRVDKLYIKAIGVLRRWWETPHEAGV
ncbi:hypothetical protein H0E84_19575 [Luteimonas sp. SJ-92]|uniref:Uncharacterized protein n=1 Tax=Luteimonas salinisoli TaxID=2752307 RepID=A0A853JJD9_9GAMM|nr:hypothetical protein [Luteimonas salinisoli]NZA28578.1 hypothetical protein [Luteimonas salinisoli]